MGSKGSEYGGVPGRIAPLPHSLTPAEEARLMRKIDPMDAEMSPDDMRIFEAVAEEKRGTIANPDGFAGGPQ